MPGCQRLWNEPSVHQRYVSDPASSLHSPRVRSPAYALQPCSAVCAGAFMWLDDLELILLKERRQDLAHRRLHVVRPRAAAVIQRAVLTKLTRRWFLHRNIACLWPYTVARSVRWSVLCAAHPGSFVFGRCVRRLSEWQLLLVAASERRECVLV